MRYNKMRLNQCLIRDSNLALSDLHKWHRSRRRSPDQPQGPHCFLRRPNQQYKSGQNVAARIQIYPFGSEPGIGQIELVDQRNIGCIGADDFVRSPPEYVFGEPVICPASSQSSNTLATHPNTLSIALSTTSSWYPSSACPSPSTISLKDALQP